MNNVERLHNVPGFLEKKLTKKIRSNRELAGFIKNVLDLRNKPTDRIEYKNVDVIYANNPEEAKRLITIYRNIDYKFLGCTPSQYVKNSIDEYVSLQDYVSHRVIGQEFDNVIILLDSDFRYDENGCLEAREHPNPNYLFPKLFYQNITRAREKLCFVIVDNPLLYG